MIKQSADAYLCVQEKDNPYGIQLTIKNNILIPSAGIDESNGNDCYILYPEDVQKSTVAIRREIQEEAALKADQTELLTVLTYHGNFFKDGSNNKIHHIGIIYQVNLTTVIPNLIPEERVLRSPISEISSEKLTPFAKQEWLNNFFRKR